MGKVLRKKKNEKSEGRSKSRGRRKMNEGKNTE